MIIILNKRKKKLTRSTWIQKKIFLTSKGCVAEEKLISSYLEIKKLKKIYADLSNKATSS